MTGAGSGIGASIATHLAEHGCKVYVADSNLQRPARSLSQCDGRGYPLALDVGNANEAAAAVERIMQ